MKRGLELLEKSVKEFNQFRERNPDYLPDFSGEDLGGLNLRGANLSRANLSKAKLNYTDASRANLNEANLSNADLYITSLEKADLQEANLQGARLEAVGLEGSDLRKANLSGANLFTVININKANLIGVIGLSTAEQELKVLQWIKTYIVQAGKLEMNRWHNLGWKPEDGLLGEHCAAGGAQIWGLINGINFSCAPVAGSMLIPSMLYAFSYSNEDFVEELDRVLSKGIEGLLKR